MFYRIFVITEDGELDSYSGSLYGTPGEYAAYLKREMPNTIPIAWEDVKSLPKDARDRYERIRLAIAARRLLGVSSALATRWVTEAARKMKLLMEDGQEELLPAEEEEVKKKPTLKIIQDFIEEIDHDELVKRTEEATKAICGGGKL